MAEASSKEDINKAIIIKDIEDIGVKGVLRIVANVIINVVGHDKVVEDINLKIILFRTDGTDNGRMGTIGGIIGRNKITSDVQDKNYIGIGRALAGIFIQDDCLGMANAFLVIVYVQDKIKDAVDIVLNVRIGEVLSDKRNYDEGSVIYRN